MNSLEFRAAQRGQDECTAEQNSLFFQIIIKEKSKTLMVAALLRPQCLVTASQVHRKLFLSVLASGLSKTLLAVLEQTGILVFTVHAKLPKERENYYR